MPAKAPVLASDKTKLRPVAIGAVTMRPWTPVKLIPYYAWASRGAAQMAVWLPLRK